MHVQKKLECHCGRKLWCSAKAAILLVIIRNSAFVRSVEQVCRKNVARWLGQAKPTQLPEQRRRCMRHLIRLRAISLCDAYQKTRKPRHVVPVLWREIRATVKRHSLRSEERRVGKEC